MYNKVCRHFWFADFEKRLFRFWCTSTSISTIAKKNFDRRWSYVVKIHFFVSHRPCVKLNMGPYGRKTCYPTNHNSKYLNASKSFWNPWNPKKKVQGISQWVILVSTIFWGDPTETQNFAKFWRKCWYWPFSTFFVVQSVIAGTILILWKDRANFGWLWKKLTFQCHVRSRHAEGVNGLILKFLNFCHISTNVYSTFKCF